MSVQNPERLATKQDLKDMYDRIRPYMGGLPEVVANKFSKGDLYSTEEKMIGQWIDGKPVYQKVISFTTPSYNTGITQVVSPTIQNAENGRIVYGYIKETGNSGSEGNWSLPIIGSYNETIKNTLADIQITLDCSTLWIRVGNSRYQNKTCYLVIQYTKTTDSPISIGSDTDYSTEEKIIGTWITGEPVYQKTIDCGALPNATLKQVAHGITNLKNVLNMYGVFWRDSDGATFPFPRVDASSNNANVEIARVGVNINITVNKDMSAFNHSYATLQYTKTT